VGRAKPGPLLFTALGNQYWRTRLNRTQIAAMPLQIFIYAIGPYDDQQPTGVGGSRWCLLLLVLFVNAGVRFLDAATGSSEMLDFHGRHRKQMVVTAPTPTPPPRHATALTRAQSLVFLRR